MKITAVVWTALGEVEVTETEVADANPGKVVVLSLIHISEPTRPY